MSELVCDICCCFLPALDLSVCSVSFTYASGLSGITTSGETHTVYTMHTIQIHGWTRPNHHSHLNLKLIKTGLIDLTSPNTHTDLREQMPSPAGIRLLRDLPAQRTRPCWWSPVHGSDHNHGPTPEGWSPRWLECPGPSARCAEGRPATPSDWRTAERTADRLPSARSRESWRCQPTRPDRNPGPSTRRPARRLLTGKDEMRS